MQIFVFKKIITHQHHHFSLQIGLKSNKNTSIRIFLTSFHLIADISQAFLISQKHAIPQQHQTTTNLLI